MTVFLQDVDVLVITDLMEEKNKLFFWSSLEFGRTFQALLVAKSFC
jgi:hypothetical protein